MKQVFSARYYPKGSGKPRAVTVSLEDGELKVMDPKGGLASIALPDLKVTTGGFQGDRIILHSLATGECITSKDRALLVALRQLHPDAHLNREIATTVNRISWSPFWRFAGWSLTLICLAAAVVLLYAGADGLINVAADRFPKSFDKQIGAIAFAQIVEEEKLDKKKPDVQRVRTLGKKLLAHMDGTGYEFEFHVLDSKELNAFSLPGGKIVVCSALMRRVKNDDELAGVLAHEISHVTLRHGLHQVLHKAGLSATIEALWANDPRLVGRKLARLLELEALSYSRTQEEAADLSGLRLSIKAGFSPEGLVHFLERMKNESGTCDKALAIFSTHPDPDNRIKSLKLELAKIKERSAE